MKTAFTRLSQEVCQVALTRRRRAPALAHRFLGTLGLAALACLAPPLAQPAAAQDGLSLEACLSQARARDPVLAGLALDAAGASLAADAARIERRPSLDLSAGYLGSTSRDGANTDFIANNAPHEVRAQLVGRWAWDPLRWEHPLRQAEAAAEGARWTLRAREGQLALDVARRFYAVLRARLAVSAIQASLNGVRRQLEGARASEKAGQSTRLDVGRAEQTLHNQEAALAGAQADRRVAEAQLALVTGLPEGARLVEPTLPPRGAAPPALRSEIRAAEAAVAQSRVALDAARLAHAPQLLFSAAVGWDAGIFPASGAPGASAGVDLNFPLWSAGRLSTQARAAELALERAKAGADAARLAAADERLAAQGAAERASAQLGALEAAASLAERNLGMVKAGFAEGALGSLDLVAAQQAALDARLAAQNARYDYAMARFQLDWAEGRLGGVTP